MDLIYCAGGNTRLAQIAIDEGFLYGARSDDVRQVRCNGMLDIKWQSYDWSRHVALVAEHRPRYAVVPDVLDPSALPLALKQAGEIAALNSRPIIVPKSRNIISRIPRDFVVGISVPTPYSGYLPPISDLAGRELHLLGGSPRQQRRLWFQYKEIASVTSADANCHALASDFGSYWDGDRWCDAERRKPIGKYVAFRNSCRGIVQMWRQIGAFSL